MGVNLSNKDRNLADELKKVLDAAALSSAFLIGLLPTAQAVTVHDFVTYNGDRANGVYRIPLGTEAYRAYQAGDTGRAVCINNNFLKMSDGKLPASLQGLDDLVMMNPDPSVRVESLMMKSINDVCGAENQLKRIDVTSDQLPKYVNIKLFFDLFKSSEDKKIILAAVIASQAERARVGGNPEYGQCIEDRFSINVETKKVEFGAMEIMKSLAAQKDSPVASFEEAVLNTIASPAYCGIEQLPASGKAAKDAQSPTTSTTPGLQSR